MASVYNCSTPPKNIEQLIECSRVFILNNYGEILEQDVQQRFYNKLQNYFKEFNKDLNQEKNKAMLQKLEMEEKQEQRRKVLKKLESEHAAGEFGGGKKKRKSRRHKKKKRNKTKRRINGAEHPPQPPLPPLPPANGGEEAVLHEEGVQLISDLNTYDNINEARIEWFVSSQIIFNYNFNNNEYKIKFSYWEGRGLQIQIEKRQNDDSFRRITRRNGDYILVTTYLRAQLANILPRVVTHLRNLDNQAGLVD